MIIYMIVSSGNYWLKSYQINGNDTVTSTWTSTVANGKVFFDWTEASNTAKKCGGTVVYFDRRTSA